MSFRILTPEEIIVYLKHTFENPDMAPMMGERWSRSPCGVYVATWGLELDYPIAVLFGYRFQGAVREALERLLTHDVGIAMDYRHLADHSVHMGRMDLVAMAVERGGVEACDYVLSLQTDNCHPDHLPHACDLARSARARHAAAEVVAGLR